MNCLIKKMKETEKYGIENSLCTSWGQSKTTNVREEAKSVRSFMPLLLNLMPWPSESQGQRAGLR